jgi:galactokinase
MVDIVALKSEFERQHGRAPRVFSAPGRVNLIGEHTDYNDGFVLPMAIDRRTYVAAAPRGDRRVRAISRSQSDAFELDFDQPGPKQRGTWGDFVEGTAQALLERGLPLVGADLLIDSDVPAGAGVSASAALEMAIGLTLVSLAGRPDHDRVQLALAGQAAEHEYVGTLSGIMDQYISALGRSGHALLIDCRTLEPTPVPLALGTARIVICDTRVKHDLASSAYNERRAQCHEAVERLSVKLPGIRALRDVSVGEFELHAAELPSPVRQRARHVVTEDARTLSAVQALTAGNLAEFGRLMVASHRSLQHDYEVSCPELDVSVDSALGVTGVYGARMTGGGFGGCAVMLVESAQIAELTSVVTAAFESRFGSRPEIFASGACDGAREEV